MVVVGKEDKDRQWERERKAVGKLGGGGGWRDDREGI